MGIKRRCMEGDQCGILVSNMSYFLFRESFIKKVSFKSKVGRTAGTFLVQGPPFTNKSIETKKEAKLFSTLVNRGRTTTTFPMSQITAFAIKSQLPQSKTKSCEDQVYSQLYMCCTLML